MKVISDKEVRVATLSGAVVLLSPNQQREVADEIGYLLIQQGAKQVEASAPEPVEIELHIEESTEVAAEEPEVVIEVVPSHDPELIKVLEQLMEEGDPDNFVGDGVPSSRVVSKLMGRTVSSDERDAAWELVLNS